MEATIKAQSAVQAKIMWSEKQVIGELSPGGKAISQVEFTSDQNLQDIVIEAVPAIANLVSMQPNLLKDIPANQPQAITLFFSAPADAPLGTRAGTIHVRSGKRTIAEPLKVAIEVKEGIIETGPALISLAQVTLSGASETSLNPRTGSLRFDVSGATLNIDPNAIRVFINSTQVPATSLQITASSVGFAAAFVEGRNLVRFIASDTNGLMIYKAATIWAGSRSLSVSVLDEQGQPATGALVTIMLGDDKRVQSSASTVNGSVIFANLPDRTFILRASASGNRLASVATNGAAGSAKLRLKAFNAPSTIDNNDFSQGTAGWEIGAAPVKIVPHKEGVFIPLQSSSTAQASLAAPSVAAPTEVSDETALRAERYAQFQADASSATAQASGKQTDAAGSFSTLSPAEGNNDMTVRTAGEGPKTVSRTFQPDPGTAKIKIRYKFITSEVPGGYYGTKYNDYYDVSIRSQNAGGVASDSQTMNGLGLSAFDASGATDWCDFTLPIDTQGDTVQVDATVANVADGAFDSQLLIDYVAAPVVSIGALTAVVKNNTATVEVKVGNPQGEITLKLETTAGSGEALFASTGSDTMTITQTTPVEILGTMESSDRDNISLKAFNADGEELDSEKFSVLWVTMDLHSSNGMSISADNSAEPVISWAVGTSALGTLYSTGASAQFWRNCVEIVGKVSPHDFVGNLKLQRYRLQGRVFFGNQSNLLGYKEDSIGGEMLRDHDPAPDGNIYDYDAPGITINPAEAEGVIARQRVNFLEYAIYEENNQIQKASDDMLWFSRTSVVKTQGADMLAADVGGDNMAGKGTTPLTWDLK
jgi:hypothetical protein